MRKIREVLRYKYEHGMSNSRIAGALSIGKGSVHNILERFVKSKLPWPLPPDIKESELESRLYATSDNPPALKTGVPLPDIAYLELELRRPHVTMQLLFEEYRTNHPNGLGRKQRFEELERPYAKPLPSKRFQITRMRIGVRVAPNYHIRYEDRYYSVPHQLARCRVDVYQVGSIIEIYHDQRHVCRHLINPEKYTYTTKNDHMPPEQFFALLVEDEYIARKNRKLRRLITAADFKPEQACIENLEFGSARGLQKADVMQLTTPTWIEEGRHIIITGLTGCGKTYLAEALGLLACKMGYRVRKVRYRILFEEIRVTKGISTYLKYLKKIALTSVLILDDFLMHPIEQADAANLM